MRYNYKSSGILSRIIFEHKDETIASQSNTVVTEYNYKQALTQRIEQANYGSVGTYGSEGIGSNTTDGKGGILIVGERGTSFLSGSATCFAKLMPITNISCNNGICVYSYEAGNVSETVGLHGPSTINFLGARRIDSFQFVFDTWQSISRFVGAAECTAKVYEPGIVDSDDFNEVDYGLITANHTNAIDNGLITELGAVTIQDRGTILEEYRRRFGFTRVIGEAQAKATNAWRGSGRIRKFGNEKSPAIYGWITDGKVRSITVLGTADVNYSPAPKGRGILPLRGISTESFGLEFSGSGSLKKFSGVAESLTFNPDEKQMLFSFIGVGSERQTDSYLGTGLLPTFSGAAESRTASDDITAGLFKVGGSGHSSETDVYIGSGVFSTFSGVSESTTWNPDEKQMLFSFTGGITSEKHSEAWLGSGILWKFGKLEALRATFDYQGSGSIKLRPRKPVTYELSELANFTLEVVEGLNQEHVNFGDNSYTWNGTTKLGGVLLKDLREKSHEKHTEVYDQGAAVEFVRADYGFLVDSNLTNCVLNSGTISTNTTASSGCIKIAPGTTLAIAPSNTYTIPNKLTVPSTYLDYGNVADAAAPRIDYGHILDSSDLRSPYGLFRISSETDVIPNATFNFVSDGTPPIFKILGRTSLPLDVSEEGTGTLFAISGAAEAIGNVKVGTGLFKLLSLTDTSKSKDFVGSGSLKKFSGLAESITFNPLERQLLFSFTGVGSEKHTEVYIGSGNLFTFSGASESITNIQVGDGLWRFNGDAHETRARDFVGSGSLKKFSGLAESLTFNPTEEQLLFSIIGVGTEKHTEAYVGSGNLFAFSGLSESVSVTERATGLFKLRSFTHASNTDNYIGFGSLKKFSGFAESIAFNPLERQLLFSFTGGITSEKHSEAWLGSGNIRKLSGSAESIRWSAQHTTGLYRITGDAHETRARDFIGSGSLKKFSGVSESLTFNPLERDMLFSFTGGITSEKHTESYVGSGFLRNFATVELRQTFDWVGSGTIKLNPRKPQTYELGELGTFTLDFYSFYNGYINLGNIDFYDKAITNLGPVELKWLNLEEGHEKHTEAYNNSSCVDDVDLDYGTLVVQNLTNCVLNSGTISTDTTANSGCIKIAPGTTLAIATGSTYTIPNQITVPSVTEDYGLVSEANAPERRDYGHILDTRSKVCPFGAFEITGTAKTHYVENIIGQVDIRVFGEGDTFWTPPYFGSGGLKIIGSLANESFTPAPHIGEGTLFAFSGAAESTSIGAVSGGLFKFGSEAYTLFSLLHPGSGVIKITGTGGESITPTAHIGSGSLRKLSGAAESITFNPLERQLLFSFTGVGGEVFTANPPEKGTEIRIFGEHVVRATNAEQPFGRIPISGEGSVPRTKVFIGSGTFKKFSGAAESITFNPLEKQMLFSFNGVGKEIFSANPPEETAELRLRGTTEPEILTFAEQPFGRIPVTGIADTDRTRSFIGSGSLKKFSGAAESITFNPLERQLLFSFTGTGSESLTIPYSGDGRLFTFNSSTVVSAAAYETTGLFRVSGVSINIRSLSHFGSGSLKKFSGAAESLTFNPTEEQMLFSFTGQGSDAVSRPYIGSGSIKIRPKASDIRFVPNWNSVGGLKLYVYGAYRFAPVWIGSGTLRKFSGTAESLTVNPTEEQMLFSFTGQGSESRLAREISKGGTVKLSGDARIVLVPNNIGSGTIFVTGDANAVRARDFAGSGSLRKLSGAAESRAIDITTLPSLFRVYGDGDIARSRPYIGSGSLRKLSGAAESLTFNPDEKQMLFSFLGQATTTRARDKVGQGTIKTLGNVIDRFSPVYIGSGTARVLGDASVVRARDFVGFGSLRKLSGAAESLTFNPLEKQMLFSFTGVGADSKTSKLLSQGGTLAIRGTSGDPLLTFAEQPRVEIDITGDSIDLRVHAYQGSGRISNVNNADDAYVRAPYIGSGEISINGIALVQVQLFQPPFTQVWII